MVFFNHATRQMTAKIVYYGPGLCGKTTNLNTIYAKTSQRARGEMVSLNTETDRTLFFDLLPMDVGVVGGFKCKLQLYTVPGQVFYNSTRKLVLKGVDGIVFVADSQSAMLEANRESIQNLEDNLRELGIDIKKLPIVFQWNKRDLKTVLPVEQLEMELNPRRLPSFQSVASDGTGVFETLRGITKLALSEIKSEHFGDTPEEAGAPTAEENTGTDVPAMVAATPSSVLASAAATPAPPVVPPPSPRAAAPISLPPATPPPGPVGYLSDEEMNAPLNPAMLRPPVPVATSPRPVAPTQSATPPPAPPARPQAPPPQPISHNTLPSVRSANVTQPNAKVSTNTHAMRPGPQGTLPSIQLAPPKAPKLPSMQNLLSDLTMGGTPHAPTVLKLELPEQIGDQPLEITVIVSQEGRRVSEQRLRKQVPHKGFLSKFVVELRRS